MPLVTETPIPLADYQSIEQVADKIADSIKTEAAKLAKAGYVVTPASVRVECDPAVVDGGLTLNLTMRAERIPDAKT